MLIVLLVMAALATGGALVIYVRLRRLPLPLTPLPATLVAAPFGMLLMYLLMVAWSAGWVVPEPQPIPFEAEAWALKPWVRARMANDLVGGRVSAGMTHAEVAALLGEGDGTYGRGGGANLAGSDSWYLWRTRDQLMLFPAELVIHYGEHGRVTSVQVLDEWSADGAAWLTVLLNPGTLLAIGAIGPLTAGGAWCLRKRLRCSDAAAV